MRQARPATSTDNRRYPRLILAVRKALTSKVSGPSASLGDDMRTRADSPTKICAMDGCHHPLRARGLCVTHYNQAHQSDRHTMVERECVACGATVLKYPSGSRKVVCSTRCRGWVQYERWPEDGKELVGPLASSCEVRPAKQEPAPRPRFASGSCAWCAAWFVHDLRITGTGSRHCSTTCTRRAAKARQLLRQGRFDIHPTARLSIYERDRWTCQLCMEAVDRDLPTTHAWAATLDHIECQSWTLIPDHSPANLRLAHRMCNSGRGDGRYHQAG